MSMARIEGPHVLVADDDEINLMLLREAMEGAGFRVTTVTDGASALKLGSAGGFDIALLDVAMPKLDGYGVCRGLRASPAAAHLPIIMITSRDDSVSIDRAYDAGATDFIAKPVNWHLIPHRLRYALRSADNDARIRELAYFDPVTGLGNRQWAMQGVADAVRAAVTDPRDKGLAVLSLELVGIGRIGENFGMQVENGVLQVIARRLPAYLQSSLLARARVDVARTGDAELAICVTGAAPRALATEIANTIAAWFQEPVAFQQHEFFIEPVVGIAVGDDHGDDAETLMMRAATARDQARNERQAGHAFYNDVMGASARDRIELDVELRRAVRNEELALYFQPKISVADGSLCGVEALLRWFHPSRGEISPAQFIPLAEESGLIIEIDNSVIRMACRQLRNWQEAGLQTQIALNLSGRHFLYGDPVATLLEETSAARISPRDLTVEITESVLLHDSGRAQLRLQRLRALGCRVAIDDFGTGYSSLSYLRRLPADMLKIDRAFITHLTDDPGDAAIVEAILALSRNLGLAVTAEGVETARQLDWLRAHGCNEAQGFLFGRAMTANQLLQRYGREARADGERQVRA